MHGLGSPVGPLLALPTGPAGPESGLGWAVGAPADRQPYFSARCVVVQNHPLGWVKYFHSISTYPRQEMISVIFSRKTTKLGPRGARSG